MAPIRLSLAVLTFLGLLALPQANARADDPKPAEPAPTTTEKDDAKKAEPAEDAANAAEQARIQAAVDALRPAVAKLRGLAWKKPVKARVMSRKRLRTYMVEEMAKEVTPEEWERDTRILRRLGLLSQTEDLKELVLTMLQSAVAGFYNPESGDMYVIEGMDIKAQQPTMFHELIHALEDQHFDLDGMEKPHRDDNPDRQFAIRCLWEGSAEYARFKFQDMNPDVTKHAAAASGKNPAAAAQQAMMQTTPAFMLLSMLLHYRTGPNFVTHQLKKYGYVDGMQRLFDDPPTTQEQVLHPYKWLGPARDYPRTVRWGGDVAAQLGKPWKKLDEHSVGELDLAMYLDFFLGDQGGRLNPATMGFGHYVDEQSRRAAHGWDGGRALYLENDDKHIMFIQALAFDSLKDAEEAGRTLGAARRKQAGDTWKGEGWVKDDKATVPTMTYDYRNASGRGRILIRGQEVLTLDGAPDATFDKAWTEVTKTRFDVHADDKGDTTKDPFEGYDLVDRRRGLGLKVPAGWTAGKGRGNPATFATASKGSTTVTFLVIGQGFSKAALPQLGRSVLGPMFDEKALKPAIIMGNEGFSQTINAGGGMSRTFYLGADPARAYIIMVQGLDADLRAHDSEICAMLKGMPGPIEDSKDEGGPDLEGAAKPAGLRSIPGY